MKRVLAVLLALVMILGMAPMAMAQEPRQSEQGTLVTAREVPGSSRLNEIAAASGEERAAQPLYADDETVTVIVQLESGAVMDHYGASAYRLDDSLSAGQAVSAFLSSDGARSLSGELLSGQQSVLNRIARLSPSSGVEVVAQWTTLVNAMAIRVPYGRLGEIQALSGVKRAYVAHTYYLPEEIASPAATAGAEGYTYDMVGLQEAWSAGYTGNGMVVAVLDTGLDLEWSRYYDEEVNDNVEGVRRCHEAFRADSFLTGADKLTLRFQSQDYTEGLIAGLDLHAKELYNGSGEGIYKNSKVPFAFDYAGDTDENGNLISGDVNVYPGSGGNAHGTHVAGTIAGYVPATEEGEAGFTGVAPDAQLLIMKVFGDDPNSGASEVSIMSALEDAMMLGADVINLSLGSDNGFSEDDTAAAEVYKTVADAGIILMTSAGNSAYAGTNNNISGSYYPSSNPDSAMMSSPAIYDSNLAVASINGSVKSESVLVWSDGETDYEAIFSDYWEVAMKQVFGGDETTDLELKIYDCGYGTYDDYCSSGLGSQYDSSTYTSTFNAGIALVKRGGTNSYGNTLSFEEKIQYASQFNSYYGLWDYSSYPYTVEYPIKAVIVYDSDPEGTELIMMSVGNTYLESCFISGRDGAAMMDAISAGQTVTLKRVLPEDKIYEWDEAGQMSSFSSWGAGPGLELKPEITAPGGNVWSAVFDITYNEGAGTYSDYDGSYAMMSGTSMSAPHMSGIGAVVKQYVTQNRLASSSVDELVKQLLVSTALPQSSGSVYYSPRLQGAGLVNVGAAVSTPAYITAEGQTVGKLELGDDPDWTGSYDISFSVHNLTGEALTYNAEIAVMRPDTAVAEDGETILIADGDVMIKTVSLGSVSVPANGSAAVAGTVTLTEEEVAALRELFPNGTYIEGFIILTSGTNPQIGLPYLAFLGDWTAAPIFDSALWVDGCTGDGDDPSEQDASSPWADGSYVWAPSILGNYDGYAYYNLGQNLFDEYAAYTQTVYHRENLTISPNGDGYLDAVNDIELYQLRDAKLVVFEVTDAETGELYFRDYVTYLNRTEYWSDYDAPIPLSVYYAMPSWDGTDLDGDVLPSGTVVNYTITAYGEGDYGEVGYGGLDYLVSDFEGVSSGERTVTFNGHELDMTGDVISVPITVDTEAPKLMDSAVSIYTAVAEDGTEHTYMTGTVYDEDGSLASIEVVPIAIQDYTEYWQTYYGSYPVTRPDYNSPFYTENIYDPALKVTTFTADVTEYVHTAGDYDYMYDYTWTGNVYLFCGDYGGNDRAYGIQVKDMAGEGLLLSTTSALLHVGEGFDLSVIDNTGSDAPLTRSSGNPGVATVDEFGHIEAVAPGQAIITVSNGTDTAVCVVAVEEYPTEVLDFSLSLENFSTLTPDGGIIVKVVNLQPADVVLDEIRWEVSEDEATAENYEGLVTCSKYTSDGLSGHIYLSYSVGGTLVDEDGSEIPAVPAGSGTLTVTLNGVSRSMTLDWAALYAASSDDGLVSAVDYSRSQTVYVTPGETAALVAQYRQTHSYVNVALYTLVGATEYNYNYDNPTAPATGLVLDGPSFAANGGSWSGRLVAEEGYTLPESIVVGTRYDYGYESWMQNYEWSTNYTYDSETGEIWVAYAPYGSTSTLIIRADGVETPGAPAGELSGAEYAKPDGTYGPFEWTLTAGAGTLEEFENVNFGSEYYTDYRNGAYYTPNEPGVSFITAASKDGTYSIDFAVICEGVKAEAIDLESHELTMEAGDTRALDVIFDPEPTLDLDRELVITSFDESVVSVNEDGTLTAVGAGTAYVKIAARSDTTVTTYCIVTVTASAPVPAIPVTPIYPVSVSAAENGSVAASARTAAEGAAVTVTAVPDEGYELESLTVTDAAGNELALTGNGDGTFTFTMPGSRVAVKAVFAPVQAEPEPCGGGETCPAHPYPDVDTGKWYHEAVDFVLEKGIMNGYGDGSFGPNDTLDRATMAQILYNLEGKPAVSGGTDFTDVAQGAWYHDAVAWADANAIVLGYGSGAYGPKDSITRQQLALILYRYAAGKGYDVTARADLSAFADGGATAAWARDAMEWAVASGLLSGRGSGVLSPAGTAMRSEVAQILMNFCKIAQ